MRRWLLVALAGCTPAVVPPLHVAADRPVTAAADARALAVGDATFILDATGASIVRNGVVIARGACAAPPCAWGDAANAAAPTGEGRWAIAVLAGELVHVTSGAEIETVTPRFGLRGTIRHVSASGRTFAAASDTELFVTRDGVHVARYAHPGIEALAAARDRLAVVTPDHVEDWDLAAQTSRTIAARGAHAAFGPSLVIATADGVFAGPSLARVAPGASAVAGAGERVWIASSDALAVWDGHALHATDAHAKPAALAGTPTGDVWVGATHLTDHATDDDPAWRGDIAPVFERVCAHCHVPGGSAGIDLSTLASWRAEKDEIRRRVLATRTMPPAGTEMSDADRRAIEAWVR